MRYQSLDGKIFEAKTLRDLAEQLWQSKFIPEPTLEEWMVGSAQRAAIYNNSVIRLESVEAHVEDLIKAGFVTPME